MLMLSRKLGEAIPIAADIELQVVAVHGDKVRIGITAPADVPVYRHEVVERICRDT